MHRSARWVAAFGAATALLIGGCSSGGAALTPEQESAAMAEASAAKAAMPPVAPGKYEQTWASGYDITTCTDWSTKMDDHERWVAAADMLTNARGAWKIDTMPSDALIDTFEADIDMNCDVDLVSNEAIADIATMLVMIGGEDQYGG